MAYRNFTDRSDLPFEMGERRPPLPDPSSAHRDAEYPCVMSAPVVLSPLEWLVVSMARKDTLRSLRRPGRLGVALGWIFGNSRSLCLADPRLEALRRLAVLSWHRGHSVASAEVRAFTAAGFTLQHYEVLMASIGAAHVARSEHRAMRASSGTSVRPPR